MHHLPVTSLRLSDLWLYQKSQYLVITFNDLYAARGLNRIKGIKEYAKIGIQKDGKRLQINSNVLQIERNWTR